MPSINLRLTEEQHAELERWAHDGHRSLQKEIIFRLFSMHHVSTRGGANQTLQADAQPRDTVTRTIVPAADPHFKPDFK